MRPDARSFSFTWLRGQQHQQELNMGRPTTRSQTSWTNQNYEAMDAGDSSPEGPPPLNKEQQKSSTRLKRFGTSFLRNVTNTISEQKYDAMEDDTEHGDLGNIEPTEHNCLPSTSKSTLSIGKRLNKTVQDVKTSFGNFSQRFRRSTRRRYRMPADSPATPGTPTRRILGRTPTKLYSPFGIDSPVNQKTPKRLGTERSLTPRGTKGNSAARTFSPKRNMKKDLKGIRRGLDEIQLVTGGPTRRSVRF